MHMASGEPNEIGRKHGSKHGILRDGGLQGVQEGPKGGQPSSGGLGEGQQLGAKGGQPGGEGHPGGLVVVGGAITKDGDEGELDEAEEETVTDTLQGRRSWRT